MSNMVKRILVGLVGIPVVGYLLYAGGLAFLVFVALLTVIGLWEMKSMLLKSGVQLRLSLAAPFAMFMIVVQAGLLSETTLQAIDFTHVLIAFVIVVMGAELFKNEDRPTDNMFATIGATVFLVLGFSSLYVLRGVTDMWGTPTAGFPLVLSVFGAIWACDSAAYFVGKAIGKNKVFPRVSPNKTWEGSIGGVVFGALAFWGLAEWLFVAPSIATCLIVGGVVAVLGQIGDFVESLVKRDMQVKDSSNIIPGHGGVLDRFDSALFAMPVAAVVVEVFL